MLLDKLEGLDASIVSMLRAASVPGAALAIVAEGRTILAKGYGRRELHGAPLTAQTIYPIASTTKSINATLLGILVDEGRLGWDVPVQNYLPHFRLGDSSVSAQVTIRDLVTMRTGLPRHDWVWVENPLSRAELVERLRYLQLSCGFRERFQYNNLTVVATGHIAEVVTGQRWEELVQEKLIGPLAMRRSGDTVCDTGNVTSSYHENPARQLLSTEHLSARVTAPSGGVLNSTVEDMARWLAFNLNGGVVGELELIRPQTLAQIHAPQVIVGADTSAPTPGASYGMGWFVDTYNGHARLSHGGYLHDVNSELMLFPNLRLGFVAFTNFGGPALARFIVQHAFEQLTGSTQSQTLADKLAVYEKKVEDTRRRSASARRVANTAPSHSLDEYVGVYAHPAYGRFEIERADNDLQLCRGTLNLKLLHWHYDAWIAGDDDRFAIHVPQPFDAAAPLLFETDAQGQINALSVSLEASTERIRFQRAAASS